MIKRCLSACRRHKTNSPAGLGSDLPGKLFYPSQATGPEYFGSPVILNNIFPLHLYRADIYVHVIGWVYIYMYTNKAVTVTGVWTDFTEHSIYSWYLNPNTQFTVKIILWWNTHQHTTNKSLVHRSYYKPHYIWRGLGKKKKEFELEKGRIPGSRWSMHDYTLSYSSL